MNCIIFFCLSWYMVPKQGTRIVFRSTQSLSALQELWEWTTKFGIRSWAHRKQWKFSSDYNRISHGFSFKINNVFLKRCILLCVIIVVFWGFFFQEDKLVIEEMLLNYYIIFYCTQHINDRWQLWLILLLLKRQLWNELLFCLVTFYSNWEKSPMPKWFGVLNWKHLCW